MQWLLLMGVSFVVSVFLQEVRGYSAIGTGVVFTAATVGILVSSFAAARLAKKYSQRTLIVAGFVVALAGIATLPRLRPCLVEGRRLRARASADRPRPGCDADPFGKRRAVQLPRGAPEARSRASRARVSNLGSTFGTAIAGTILVSVVARGTRSYAVAMIVPRRVRAHRSRSGPAPPCQDREGVARSLPRSFSGLSTPIPATL